PATSQEDSLLDTRPGTLNSIAARASQALHDLGVTGLEGHELLSRASGARQPFTLTVWFGGVFDTHDGVPMVVTASQFAEQLRSYGERVVPKGQGSWFAGAT